MFSAFTPLAGGTPDTYKYPVEYPYDLDGSLDFMRPSTGISAFPFPVSIGYVNGLIPLYDINQYKKLMLGENQFGPWTGAYPTTPEQLSFVFPDWTGALQKVRG